VEITLQVVWPDLCGAERPGPGPGVPGWTWGPAERNGLALLDPKKSISRFAGPRGFVGMCRRPRPGAACEAMRGVAPTGGEKGKSADGRTCRGCLQRVIPSGVWRLGGHGFADILSAERGRWGRRCLR